MPSAIKSLLERLSSVHDATPSEKKLLDFFEAGYPQIAFANLAEISARNGVSKATVTRFVRRLGYENFHVFIRSLRQEVAQNFDSPKERHAHEVPSPTPVRHLKNTFESAANDLQRTLAQTDEATFARVLALLADPNRPLYLMTVASGQGILRYFYTLMKFSRKNLHMLGGDTSTLGHEIMDIDENAVLFAQAIDRHAMATLAVLKYFHQQGCQTILLTNRHSSPLLQYAHHTLFVHTEGQRTFKSRCSALVMLEAILAGVTEQRKEDFDKRYGVMDLLTRQLNVFVQK